MRIAYIQKTSLIEYPGKISAVVFTQGCNLRCPYCHNPELVSPERFSRPIPEEDIFSFLDRRKGRLDGIVITGGEPILQRDLIDFMQRVKEMGFLVKLDTNGTNPDALKTVIDKGLADYIAMDIKAPAAKYPLIAGTQVDMGSISECIKLIMDSGIDYEFRTTWVKEQLTIEDVIECARLVKGARLYAIQRFNPSKHLDQAMLLCSPPTDAMIAEAMDSVGKLVSEYVIR